VLSRSSSWTPVSRRVLGGIQVKGCAANAKVILIPTFRRPEHLKKLVSSLQENISDSDTHVVVGDNDPIRRDNVEAQLRDSVARLEVTYLHIATQGLATVRNTLVEYGIRLFPHAKYLIFLDDDVIVESPDWLSGLVEMADQTRADLVSGPVFGCFPTAPSLWALHSDFTAVSRQPDGPVRTLNATSNLLMRVQFLKSLSQPIFDEKFNFSGGEDYHFFLSCRRSAVRMAFTNRAAVKEMSREERSTFYGITRRCVNVGRYQAIADRMLLTRRQLLLRYIGILLQPVLLPVKDFKYGMVATCIRQFWVICTIYGYLTGYKLSKIYERK
jgi:glycosyltransferase involved in cell wall biosynthesis